MQMEAEIEASRSKKEHLDNENQKLEACNVKLQAVSGSLRKWLWTRSWSVKAVSIQEGEETLRIVCRELKELRKQSMDLENQYNASLDATEAIKAEIAKITEEWVKK